MSFAAISLGVGAAAAIGSVAVQASAAKKQRKLAEQINPVDPGPNTALQDNARMLEERYGNYEMPGFDAARADINQAGQYAFDNAVQGATSSGDVLDAASRIAYGTQRSMSDLYRQNAAGKEQALMQYLSANAAAGTDTTNWNRQEYLNDVNRKAQLTNAAELNRMNAIQSGLGAVGSLSSYAAGMFENRALQSSGYGGVQGPNATPGTTGYVGTVSPGAEVERMPVQPVATAPFTPSASTTQIPQRTLSGKSYLDPVSYMRMTGQTVQPNYTLPY